jgi:radical SAM protein with 4Fe4S-binding SPASM domain
VEIQDFPLWEKLRAKGLPAAFDLEITARCNNDCRHCYIDLPAGDLAAKSRELSVDEILAIGGQAVALGTVWCLLTGGEPLLRDDFEEVFLGLKRLGLLVNVFTNACLVTPAHVDLFREYPPRDVEVTVYGATRETYEAVTRRPGSWGAFTRGLTLLHEGGVNIRLKAMALRSNYHEFDLISEFCRRFTKDYYRFDPVLHLRFDGDERRNDEIRSERLTPDEVAACDRDDTRRHAALLACGAEAKAPAGDPGENDRPLFCCGVGESSFTVGYDGTFRLCSSLLHPGTTYDLRNGTLRQAWYEWRPRVRRLRSGDARFMRECGTCPIANLCLWCPAHASLETGSLDGRVEYFCEVAHARADALRAAVPTSDQREIS